MGGVENKASGIQRLGRNQEAYDKFAQAVEVPLMVVTILWLPVHAMPMRRRLTRPPRLVARGHYRHGGCP